MTTITHILAPVIIVRLIKRKNDNLTKWDYVWIGLAGGLADMINPHLYLKDRLTSWSHGLPFWVLFSLALILVALILIKTRWVKYWRLEVAMYCSLAYLLHLFCDGISGGINLFYPLQNYFWGATLIPFPLWIPLDVMNIVLVVMLFRRRQSGW